MTPATPTATANQSIHTPKEIFKALPTIWLTEDVSKKVGATQIVNKVSGFGRDFAYTISLRTGGRGEITTDPNRIAAIADAITDALIARNILKSDFRDRCKNATEIRDDLLKLNYPIAEMRPSFMSEHKAAKEFVAALNDLGLHTKDGSKNFRIQWKSVYTHEGSRVIRGAFAVLESIEQVFGDNKSLNSQFWDHIYQDEGFSNVEDLMRGPPEYPSEFEIQKFIEAEKIFRDHIAKVNLLKNDVPLRLSVHPNGDATGRDGDVFLEFPLFVLRPELEWKRDALI